jgi:PAS domain S-box-containing protein
MSGDRISSRGGIRGIVRALAQPVTYLGVVLLVAIYCTLAYLFIADRKEANDDAKRHGTNLVRIIDQSFSHIFKSIDASLLFLRKSYQQNPSTFDLSAWVHDPSVKNELTFDFTICDANGRIVDSSFLKSVIGADRSEEEPFRVHVNSATDELFISKPFILKYNGQWGIALSRRITASDGTFAGVITALLDPRRIGEQISRVDLGQDGSVGLLGLDGVVRARAVRGQIDWENIGRQLPPGAGVLGHVERAKSGHYWSAPSFIDNVSRFISYRALESFPLIAFVGISEIEVYRYVAEEARIYWGIALLLTVAVLIAIGIGARRERKLIETTSKMQQAQDALQQSQERYTLVEGAVSDGIFDRNLLTDEVYLSPRWKNILGFADDELPNVLSSFLDRIHPDDKMVYNEVLRAHLEANKPYAFEFRLMRKNGGYCWVESRGKALRDATNRAVRLLGIITDISRRKQAEALIEESRSNLTRAEAMFLLGNYKYELGSTAVTWSERAGSGNLHRTISGVSA